MNIDINIVLETTDNKFYLQFSNGMFNHWIELKEGEKIEEVLFKNKEEITEKAKHFYEINNF